MNYFRAVIRCFIVCLIYLLLVPMLTAQVVNVESRRLNSTKPGWQGSGELWYSSLRNQSRQYVFGSRFSMQYARNQYRYLMIGDAQFSETNGQNIQSQGFLHFRFNEIRSVRFAWEAFGQVFYSRQMRLYPRFTFGAGPRYRLLNNDSMRIYVGGSFSFEHERFPDPITQYSSERLNFYTSVVITRFKNLSLDWMFLFQPRLFDFSDRRYQTELRLDVKINQRFSLRISGNLLYDTNPPGGVPKLFSGTRSGLLFDF